MAKDGEEFPLGSFKIKAIHTPGHTWKVPVIFYIKKTENPIASSPEIHYLLEM